MAPTPEPLPSEGTTESTLDQLKATIYNPTILGHSQILQRLFFFLFKHKRGFPGGSDGKESAWSAGDPGSIPGSGRSSRGRNGYPLQYSCLENSMDRGAWQATVHRITKESETTEQLTLLLLHPNVKGMVKFLAFHLRNITEISNSFGIIIFLPTR